MSADLHAEKVLVVDFGSQYTQLIARRVREARVYCEIVPFDAPAPVLREPAVKGFVLSGGPESVTGAGGRPAPRIPEPVLASGLPVLGICYGLQAMMQALGGAVEAHAYQEFGHAELAFSGTDLHGPLAALRDAAGDTPSVWMSHGDRVTRIAPDFDLLASSANAPVAAVAHVSKPWFGLQFHPEVTHTEGGQALLGHFVRDVCGCSGSWTSEHIAQSLIESLAEQLGEDRVVLGLSGGVDSSVTAALLHRAVGDRLVCIFVDNGLLRMGEGDAVTAAFRGHDNQLPLNIVRVDARKRFMSALAGETDPEAKRRIIGRTFVDVFQEEAERLRNVKWLGQGTIYPDVIESAASRFGKAHVIKSHHNVGGLPETLHLKLVEPLRELFKDEVRAIGRTLGLPDHFIDRHPFPGPGLGVRILGEVREEFADALRRADAIFLEELRAAGWYERTSQAFAVFLPVKSVGVVGDARRFAHVIALRAVTTTDFMTADWARLPWDLVAKVSNRIVNEIDAVSRVVYDVSSKPPATIEWE